MVKRESVHPKWEDSLDYLWEAEAKCRGANPGMFFPERGASTRAAKQVCSDCKVRAQCLESALEYNEKFGIWGGLSERERRRVRRERVRTRREQDSGDDTDE